MALNKSGQVTNKSNVSVLVLNAFNQSSDSTQMGYIQTLEILYAEGTNTNCTERGNCRYSP